MFGLEHHNHARESPFSHLTLMHMGHDTSCPYSQIGNVYNYILNQEKHHAKQTFKDEYMDFLKKFEIEHDVKHLFEWMEA